MCKQDLQLTDVQAESNFGKTNKYPTDVELYREAVKLSNKPPY